MSGANRPQLARANTNPHSRSAPSARPYSQRPSGAQRPAPHSPNIGGKTPLKRPPEPRSRGNSPPDKRTRVNDQPPSRQNSASSDNRHTDTNAGGSHRSDARRSSIPQSSSHAPLTGGNSGGSTPTYGAPPVPSMLARPPSGPIAPMPITLASLRSVKQKKEAIVKAAALQTGRVNAAAPQREKLEEKLSAKLRLLEDLPSQFASLKLQVDRAPDLSEKLVDFERRLIELESNKDIKRRLEQLEHITKGHTAELITLTDLNAAMEELKQAKSAIKQDLSDNQTQLQQNGSDIQKLTEDMKHLIKEFGKLDKFRKEQEKLNISPTLESLTRDIADSKKEQAKFNIASRLEKMSRDIANIRDKEKKTYEITRDNDDAICKYIGLKPSHHADFDAFTLVERVDRLTDTLKDHEEKGQREQSKFLATQKSSATPEEFERLRSKQLALSKKQDELTAALVRLEKLQDQQTKKLEKQEKIASTIGQIQNIQSTQAKVSTEHEKLTTRQGTNESRIQTLEDNNMTASSQLDATYTSQMKDLNDNLETSKAKICQIEQQLSTLDHRFSSLHIEQINDNVEALKPRLAHLEQLSKKSDDYATTLQIKQVNDSLQALVPKTTQLEQQLSQKEEAFQKVSSLPIQISQIEQRLRACEHQTVRPGALASPVAAPTQGKDYADAGDVSDLRSRTASLEADIKILKEDTALIGGKVDDLYKEADEDRQSMGDRLNEVFNTTGIIPSIRQLEQRMNALQQQRPTEQPIPDLTLLEEATSHLREDLAQLKGLRAEEAARRQQEFIDVRSQMAAKASTAYVDEALNNLRAVFRGFQDQYNNISTDELHLKMVHWFLQNYPSNPTQVLEQLAALQGEIRVLKASSRDTVWLQSKIQDLKSLVTMSPRLSALVHSADEIQFLLENTARFDAASKNADEARLKADKIEMLLGKDGVDVQSLSSAVQDVQQTIQAFQSASVSFITRQEIPQIKEDLGNEIREHYTSKSNKERMDVETTVTRLTDRVQSLDDKLTADIKEAQEAQLIYPSLLKSIAELQSIIYGIHQNWPSDSEPFECVFSLDFRPKPLPQANPKSGSATKGKARRL